MFFYLSITSWHKNPPYGSCFNSTIGGCFFLLSVFTGLGQFESLFPFLAKNKNHPDGWFIFIGIFPRTAVRYRLAYARCPRRRKTFPERFSSASLPPCSNWNSPIFICYYPILNGILCAPWFFDCSEQLRKICVARDFTVCKCYRAFAAASPNPTGSHPYDTDKKKDPSPFGERSFLAGE